MECTSENTDSRKPSRLRIKKMEVKLEEFSHLTVGSEHDIVDPPANDVGIWVQGKTKPIRLMIYEYEIIAYKERDVIGTRCTAPMPPFSL